MWLAIIIFGVISISSFWVSLVVYLLNKVRSRLCTHIGILTGVPALLGLSYKFMLFLWDWGLAHPEPVNKVLNWLNS